MSHHKSSNPLTRREALRKVGNGFGMMAFAGMVGNSLARAGAVLDSEGNIGISKLDIERLFQDFGQATPETAKKYGGTGLGLLTGGIVANPLGTRATVLDVVGASLLAGSVALYFIEAPKDGSPRGAATRGQSAQLGMMAAPAEGAWAGGAAIRFGKDGPLE